MKKSILKNKYLFLLTLFLLTVSMSVSASFTIAKYTKTVDVGTIRLDFSKEKPTEQSDEPVDSSYTVQKDDTLLEIAERFSTTVEKLQAYNDIEGTLITEGQEIKIPPQDYVIPEPSVPQDAASVQPEQSETSDISHDEQSDTPETEPVTETTSEPVSSEASQIAENDNKAQNNLFPAWFRAGNFLLGGLFVWHVDQC